MSKAKPVDKPVDKPVGSVDEIAALKHEPAMREAIAGDRPAALAAVEQANYAVANADLRQPPMDIEE